ncbi:MAG TPA: metallopeptidase [Bacillota bacterium]|nr:metallopeptidase [Bacillota bacterium]
MNRGVLLSWLLVCLGQGSLRAGEPSVASLPTARTVRQIEGWTVRVDDRLLTGPDEMLGRRALQLLEAKLADITFVVDQPHLVRLQAIPIVLDLNHGKLHAMQYHPSPAWLEAHGYATNLAKCVHICEAADFVAPRQINEQPWVVLHELAHAYHDQVLGFEEPRITQAYERFKRSGHGEKALLFDGTCTRHYGLTNPKEFFAEMTEAYFGLNDFYPFNRAELMTAEPEIYQLLQNLWGPVQTARPVLHPKP